MPDKPEVIKLEAAEGDTAQQLWSLFQRSYRKEAELIGSDNFPPLGRTVDDIRGSHTTFCGLLENGAIRAAAEFEYRAEVLSIEGLVVDPEVFQRGYGSRLLESLLKDSSCSRVRAETSERNLPALLLYAKFDFYEMERYPTEEGFDMVRLGADLH